MSLKLSHVKCRDWVFHQIGCFLIYEVRGFEFCFIDSMTFMTGHERSDARQIHTRTARINDKCHTRCSSHRKFSRRSELSSRPSRSWYRSCKCVRIITIMGNPSHIVNSSAMFCFLLHCILYCTVLYCTVLCCTVLYCTVLCCTVLYCTIVHCTVLYCTVLYCTVLYCTIL